MEFCCCLLSLSVSHLLGKPYALDFDVDKKVKRGSLFGNETHFVAGIYNHFTTSYGL